MKRQILLFTLFSLLSSPAFSFGDIWVSPSNPDTNSTITVYVELNPLDPDVGGMFFINGNEIKLELYTSDPPLPGPNTARLEEFEYGNLPAGDYTIQYYSGAAPFADVFRGEDQFTVTQAVVSDPTPVPTFSQTGTILVILLLLIAARRRQHNR